MIFIIKTDDEVAGLDITSALTIAGISHTIISKQRDEAAQLRVNSDSAEDAALDNDFEFDGFDTSIVGK